MSEGENNAAVASEPETASRLGSKTGNAKLAKKGTKKGRATPVRKEGGYVILGFRDNPAETFVVKRFKTAKRAIAWTEDNAELLDRMCSGHTMWKYYEVDDDGKMIPAA